jgi:O-antigen ligase
MARLLPDKRVRLFACAGVRLPADPGGTARTGLLCIGLLGVLSLRSVKNRFLYVGAIAALGLAAVPFLPQTYTARMSTIENHAGDQSASTRLAVWAWTIDYAKANPLGGGFDSFRSKLTIQTRNAATTAIHRHRGQDRRG